MAGPDDGRMYGMSDTGYQRTLQRLTDAEIEANEAATARHRKFTVKLFMDGTEARGGTREQVECTNELLWVINTKPPMVIAVHG